MAEYVLKHYNYLKLMTNIHDYHMTLGLLNDMNEEQMLALVEIVQGLLDGRIHVGAGQKRRFLQSNNEYLNMMKMLQPVCLSRVIDISSLLVRSLQHRDKEGSEGITYDVHVFMQNQTWYLLDDKGYLPHDTVTDLNPNTTMSLSQAESDDYVNEASNETHVKEEHDKQDHERYEPYAWDMFKPNEDEEVSRSAELEVWKTVNTIIKILTCTVFFGIVLCTAVISKLTFLMMTYYINPQNRDFDVTNPGARGSDAVFRIKPSGATDVKWVWGLMICICTPYIFTFILRLWQLITERKSKSDVQLAEANVVPKDNEDNLCCVPLFVALVVETVHSISLCMLVFFVIPCLDPLVGCLLTTNIAVIPSFLKLMDTSTLNDTDKAQNNYFSSYSSVSGTHPIVKNIKIALAIAWAAARLAVRIIKITLHATSAPAQLLALILWTTKVTLKIKSVTLSVVLPVSLIFISITWWQNFVRNDGFLGKIKKDIKEQKVKIDLLTSLWKTILTFIMPSVMFAYGNKNCIQTFYFMRSNASECSLLGNIVLTNISPPTESSCHDSFPLIIAAVNILSSAVCYKIAQACCQVRAQIVCFSLPLLLATPTTFLFLLLSYSTSNTNLLFLQCVTSWVEPISDMSAALRGYTIDFWIPLAIVTYITLFYDNNREETKETAMIYVCATMWHESEQEMAQLIRSLLRIDEDQNAIQESNECYMFEAHIYFDDAYEYDNGGDVDFRVNKYVKRLCWILNGDAKAKLKIRANLCNPKKTATPYGSRLEWTLLFGNTLTVHLKNRLKIRKGKRWSQVMYMHYFLGHRLAHVPVEQRMNIANNTFILALDGDVDFQADALRMLMDRMRRDPNVGAACGRIHPIGSGPIVWYQKFEYAISQWLQKATEHVLGCVLCSPGCFSLFRGSALMHCDVIGKYSTLPTESRDYIQCEQGEDRWLCNLLLQNGHRVEYCAASDSFTFAPEGFNEFFNQRKRWIPSTIANTLDLLQNWKKVTRVNNNISCVYIMYQILLMASSIITPGTVFLLVMDAIDLAIPNFPVYASLIINIIPIVVFVLIVLFAHTDTQLLYAKVHTTIYSLVMMLILVGLMYKHHFKLFFLILVGLIYKHYFKLFLFPLHFQLFYAKVLTTLYSLVMMLILVGLIYQAAEFGYCSVSTIVLTVLIVIFLVSAILHPQEFTCVFHGIFYFLFIPSVSMLLMIYALGNMHVVSWGTRENSPAASPTELEGKVSRNRFQTWWKRLARRPDDDGSVGRSRSSSSPSSSWLRCAVKCVCLSDASAQDYDSKFKVIMDTLEAMVKDDDSRFKVIMERLDEMEGAPTDATVSESQCLLGTQAETTDRVSQPPSCDTGDHHEVKTTLKSIEEGQQPGELPEHEVKFWSEIIEKYLNPIAKDAEEAKKMADKLLQLRNSACLFFFIINSLFVILISTLQIASKSSNNLSFSLPCVSGRAHSQKFDLIAVVFMLVVGVLLVIQFLGMFYHRLSTFLHIASFVSFTGLESSRVNGTKTTLEMSASTTDEDTELLLKKERPENRCIRDRGKRQYGATPGSGLQKNTDSQSASQ
ncbi:chitin synthase chs-1-like [Gigantopelta aegis]|uniref:chitin synthase chs-1-like n=1 Tax=Gigantopelta aegis TaxID=1735272 RepID=UPI001B8879F8|nr:chitin synthase chs-1-like [Gigantopelta aegis]